MTFAEKLKNIRKKAGISQDKLAEKLGVSRQAVTKWETEAGIPDIENIRAVSALFHISIDELLSNEMIESREADYLYESITEYDIDRPKRYDMNFGGADTLILSGYEGEKIRIRLASNTLTTLQEDFKLKIDDIKNRIDLDISRKNNMTEAAAKEALLIKAELPNKYIGKIELAANAKKILLQSLDCESMELDIKTQNVELDGVSGTVEIDCNLDMRIVCKSFNGWVELNQISATSKIFVPENTPFTAAAKGIGTSISYEKGGKPASDFSAADSENAIRLNGIKSELIISTLAEEEK